MVFVKKWIALAAALALTFLAACTGGEPEPDFTTLPAVTPSPAAGETTPPDVPTASPGAEKSGLEGAVEDYFAYRNGLLNGETEGDAPAEERLLADAAERAAALLAYWEEDGIYIVSAETTAEVRETEPSGQDGTVSATVYESVQLGYNFTGPDAPAEYEMGYGIPHFLLLEAGTYRILRDGYDDSRMSGHISEDYDPEQDPYRCDGGVEETMPLLIYRPEEATVGSVLWVLKTGDIIQWAERLLSAPEEEKSSQVAWDLPVWDGNTAFLTTRDGTDYKPLQPGVQIKRLNIGQSRGKGHVMAGLQTVILSDSGEIVRLPEVPKPEGTRETVLLSSSLEKGVFRMVVLCLDDRDGGWFLCYRGGLFNGTAAWGQPIPIPENYMQPLTQYGTPRLTAIVGDRCYFSGGRTVAWLDLSDGTVGDLSGLTDQVDAMLPDMRRAQGQGGEFWVCPVGQWGDLAAAHIEYQKKDDLNRWVDAYLAWEGDALIGVLTVERDENGADRTITTYGSDGELLKTLEPGYILLRTPNSNY